VSGVMSCMSVFEHLERNMIIKASLPHRSMEEECHCVGSLLAAGIGEILHCEKSFNAVVYRRI